MKGVERFHELRQREPTECYSQRNSSTRFLGDPGAVGRVEMKGVERFHELRQREPTECYSQRNSSTTYSLIEHKKYFCAQSESSICRGAFVIFLYEKVYLQTRLFAIPVRLAPAWELSSRRIFQ